MSLLTPFLLMLAVLAIVLLAVLSFYDVDDELLLWLRDLVGARH